jgi:hypothetical protein
MARVSHRGSSRLVKPFTPADRRRLIERTEELLGRKKLAALIERQRNDRTENPHRLIELHLRLARTEKDWFTSFQLSSSPLDR